VTATSACHGPRRSGHPRRLARTAGLLDPEDILEFPPPVVPVETTRGATLAEMGPRAVAITVTTDGGQRVRLVTAHLKSKLLTFPGRRFRPPKTRMSARRDKAIRPITKGP
jgi:hypothetical protein